LNAEKFDLQNGQVTGNGHVKKLSAQKRFLRNDFTS